MKNYLITLVTLLAFLTQISFAQVSHSTFSFDGVDDYINCGNHPSVQLTEKVSLAAWINPSSTGNGNDGVISKYRSSQGFLLLSHTGGQIYFFINSTYIICTIPVDEWSFVVATYDKNNMKIYVNGTEIVSSAYTAAIGQPNEDLLIGHYQENSSGTFFNGSIANAMIWNEVLTSTQITELYNEGIPKQIWKLSPTLKNNMLMAFPLNAGAQTGIQTDDHSGNGNNGNVLNELTLGITTLDFEQDLEQNVIFIAGSNGMIEGNSSQSIVSGNSTISVKAIPKVSFHFTGWSDGSEENPRIIDNVTENQNFTANFAPMSWEWLSQRVYQGVGWQGLRDRIEAGNYDGSNIQDRRYAAYWWSGNYEELYRNLITIHEAGYYKAFRLTIDAGTEDGLPGTLYIVGSWQEQTEVAGLSQLPILKKIIMPTDETKEFKIEIPLPPGGAIGQTFYAGMILETDYLNQLPANYPFPAGSYQISKLTNVEALIDVEPRNVEFVASHNGSLTGETSQVVEFNGTATAVTAVPQTNYHFEKWSNGSTENPLTLENVIDDQIITAHFTLDQYSVAFNTDGNGTIQGLSTQAVSHGTATSAVEAIANTGYEFINWSNGSIENPLTLFNVISDASLTANFSPIDYLVMFMTIENGTISGEEFQLVAHGTGSTSVTAVPNAGYTFTQWDDGNTDNPRTLTDVTDDELLIAEFAPIQYNVTFNTDGNGTLSGEASQTVNYDSSTSAVTAVPNAGYTFTQWSDGNTENPRVLDNVSADITLTAEFTANLQIEFGSVSTDANWTPITFTKTFIDPVVIAGPPTYNDVDMAVVRIKDVSSTGCLIKVDNWDYINAQGRSHGTETVHYTVIEKGTFTLPGGQKLEAGTFTKTNASYSTINLQNDYSQTPIVITTVQTENATDPDGIVVTTRVRNIDLDSFDIKLQEEEGNNTAHAQETVAYLALDEGTYNIGSDKLKVGKQGGVDERWDSVNSTDYNLFIAGFQTVAGDDPGAMRIRGTVGTDLEVYFEEEQAANTELGHANETVGYMMVQQGTGIQVEFGSVSADSNWVTVNLTKSFVDPVVIAGPPSYNDAKEAIVRIKDVTATSFDISVQKWQYLTNPHGTENVDFMVMEKGSHTLEDGSLIEVGTTTLSNSSYKTVGYQTQAATPVVLASVMTNNDPIAVTRRLRNADLDSFQIKLQEEEGSDNIHASETVGYIILPTGDFSINGKDFTVGTQYPVDEKWYSVPSAGYQKFIATFQTVAGDDPASMRMRGTIGTDLEIVCDEEQASGSEKNHANETAGFVLTGSSPSVNFIVNFNADNNGSISGEASQQVASGESTSSITAIANAGYTFSRWDDGLTDNPRVITNVTEDITVTALFKAIVVTTPVTATLVDQTFDHSDFNRRDSITYADGTSWAYVYDGLGNLQSANKTHATDPAQNLNYNYTYDDIGNRLTANESGVSKTYTPNDLNQYDQVDVDGIVESIAYDDEGNPLSNGDWDLFWNVKEQLKRMAHKTEDIIIEFKYDYRGFRGEKLVRTNGTLTKHIAYIYDGNLVSAEVNVLNGQQKLIRKYTWGLDPAGTRQEVGGIGALVGMESFDENGESNKFHMVSDAGGNVVNVLHSKDDGTLGLANSYEYGPFGQVIAKSETVENPYQYNTKYTDDETGLVYYGYRYYDAKNGRWLNQDPIGVNGGINTYNSVSNNMVNGFSGNFGFQGGMQLLANRFTNNLGIDAWGLDFANDLEGWGANDNSNNTSNNNGGFTSSDWWDAFWDGYVDTMFPPEGPSVEETPLESNSSGHDHQITVKRCQIVIVFGHNYSDNSEHGVQRLKFNKEFPNYSDSGIIACRSALVSGDNTISGWDNALKKHNLPGLRPNPYGSMGGRTITPGAAGRFYGSYFHKLVRDRAKEIAKDKKACCPEIEFIVHWHSSLTGSQIKQIKRGAISWGGVDLKSTTWTKSQLGVN